MTTDEPTTLEGALDPDPMGEALAALVGDDADTPGALDEYKIAAAIISGRPVVTWYCPRQHGKNTGHVGVIARNADMDQTGLTLGELVRAALDHESEAHA